MKSLLSIIFIFCSLSVIVFGQNRWTVSPNPEFASDFHSVKEACNSTQVQAGDMLMLHGGYYGNDTITKQIGIVGTGYYLGANGEETLQGNNTSAQFGNLVIEATGENSYITGVETNGQVYLYAPNVVIVRCRINSFFRLGGQANYVTIEQSILNNGLSVLYPNETDVISLNISNCFLGLYNSYSFSASNGTTPYIGQIKNCVITGIYQYTSNVTFLNNVFTYKNSSDTGPDVGLDAAIYVNNIFVGTTNSTANGNQENIPYTDIFIDPSEGSPDGQYQLATDSPAAGAGVSGVDCGMFGGDNPYVLSGIPGIPNIYSLSTPNNATGSGGLNVEVKVKSNN